MSQRPGPAERFRQKWQEGPDGCRLWTSSTNPKGYGWFWNGERMVLAHKWAWETKNGPVPAGLVLDHVVCDTPACVNDEHLAPATSRANTLRSPRTMASKNAAKVRCPRGHDYTRRGTRRDCQTCQNENRRARRANR